MNMPSRSLVMSLLITLLLTGGGAGAMAAGGPGNAGSGVPAIGRAPHSSSALLPSPIDQSTDAQSTTVTYTYDAAGRLIEANYGSVAITYGYDNSGNLLQRTVTRTSRQLYLPLLLR